MEEQFPARSSKKEVPTQLNYNIYRGNKKKLQMFRGLFIEKIDGKPTVYVCRDQTCMPPTNKIDEMLELLKK